MDFRPNGTEYISKLIENAVKEGSRMATVTGNYIIDSAIRIPSDFTLILDGCHLVMADGCYSNMFVNFHNDTEVGKTPEGTDRNISIIGKNGAVIDGGKYNGLSEKTHLQNGLPPIWKNNLILFTNVDGFEISGISCYNQRWWALNFVYCSNGRLYDINFKSCDIGIDKNGNEYHGLKRETKSEALVKNGDGIDIRKGCHDILIENITGFTQDDTVAVTALNGRLEKQFEMQKGLSDIYNITIKNVCTASFQSNVRLLNQGGIKLHDISIDGVEDTSDSCPYMDIGVYTVRVGDTRLYGSRHATTDETYNISIKNIRSRALTSALSISGGIRNLTIENVEQI